jgi:NTP pyrophosphatase (non-canonical NTP hydrolase)
MENLTVKQLTDLLMRNAKDKGFGTKPEEINTMEKLALIHSEVSEALKAYRHKRMNGKDGFAEELADAVSRILHLAGVHNINLEKEILKKIESNKSREWDWDNINETHV